MQAQQDCFCAELIWSAIGAVPLPPILLSNNLSQQAARLLLDVKEVQIRVCRRCTCACWPTAQHQNSISSVLRDTVSTFCLGNTMLNAVYASMQAAAPLPARAGAC